MYANCNLQLPVNSVTSFSVMWTLNLAWTHVTQRSQPNVVVQFSLRSCNGWSPMWIVDQFLTASHCCCCFWKRHCRRPRSPKIAQWIFTHFENLLNFTNFKTESHEWSNYDSSIAPYSQFTVIGCNFFSSAQIFYQYRHSVLCTFSLKII